MLKGKTIVLGVSSSIAAYKACEVVSQLKKLGAEVWVAMTREATKLVSPLTFRTLSGNPAIVDLFADELSSLPVPHISLSKRADLIVIAPCTANLIGKLAGGIADDPLTTIALASTAPKLIAPAMNCEMWRNPAVIENVARLKERGYAMLGPVEGKLACGDEDIGRMSEPEEIVSAVVRRLGIRQDLKERHILITAGATREAIDPVRYISNHSSGKMGYALALAARERGAVVTLISGPTHLPAPLDIQPVKVESAGGMLEAVLDFYNNAHAVISAAAVADYVPKLKMQNSKLKKTAKTLKLELSPTPDILKTISQQKGRKGRTLVGFALETEDLIKNAKAKLKVKDLDLIVANGTSTFDAHSIKFSIVDRSGNIDNYPLQPKEQAAQVILDRTKACLRK
jgi:phosphopantothenoylcysteine decarboxylase/phosphopantothenate--cysteine ligase